MKSLEIKLNQEAHLNNGAGGDWRDNAYTAHGTVNGLPCKIWWLNINPDAEDESDCCDWDNPYIVELDSATIDPDEFETVIIR